MAFEFKEENRFNLDEFLDTFGKEFCKHEVLWKPKPNCKEFGIQSATQIAYKKLAQALNLSVEAILELLETFPAACLDLIRRYEVRRKVDAGCRLPDWLTLLAGRLRYLEDSTKYMKSAAYTRYDIVRALYESARMGLRTGPAGVTDNGTEDEASPLRGPRAIAYFVAKHGVREEEVLPAWCSALELCVVKLRAVLAAGDQPRRVPPALRPASAERALADLALLHDRRVSQILFLTPAKLRTLVLLFQLIVAAKDTYDGERRRRDAGGGAPDERGARDGASRDDNKLTRLDSAGREETCEVSDGDGTSETAVSGGITDTTSASSGHDSAIEDLSVECVETCSVLNLLRERIVERAPRCRSDVDHATLEESTDDELHMELHPEPDIHVISSDTSVCEIDESRVEESGSDIMDKTNLSHRERESNISARSQNHPDHTRSDKRSEYPTIYRYGESESNSSDERKAVWALVYTDFMKRGRSASLISLQHRWVELLHHARGALLTAWSSDARVDRNVHPLLLVVAHWFPEIVTENLPPWKRLVLERQIVLESDIKDIIHKYQENDNVLLNITENLAFPDLLKKYVTNKNVTDPHFQSQSTATYKHLSYQTQTENTSSIIINSTHEVIQQESQAQDNAINNEFNVNNCINTMLDQIDPSKAKIVIIIDEDSDEDAKDGNSTIYHKSLSHGTRPDLNNLNVSKSERAEEQNNHIPFALEEGNKLTEINLKNTEKELEDKLNYINSLVMPRSELFVGNNSPELNENINDENELLKDKQTASHDVGSQDEPSSLRPYKSLIDDKLVNPARVVITPIEHLPEWKKHSRNGVIKCRNFSLKNFTKPVTATSKRLSKSTPFINTNKNHGENNKKNEVRIKFEDSFESDFCFGDDINNGIKYQKYIELYSMPDHTRNNRIKLTRLLKLSRTYFSLNFWSLDSNIELMKLCKPMSIKLSKGIPRVAKRVELSDINEVRRINRSILTAQVSPTVDTTAQQQAQRSSASQEAANSTNNSIPSKSGTTRERNGSLSSALDSTELLKLLTNYAIQTKIPKKSVIESVTKEITLNGNLMDSIIDTMRLADQNNIQHSTVTSTLHSVQQSSLPSSDSAERLLESCNTNISKNIRAPQTFNTTQKSTEKMKNINNTSLNLEETKMPNVSDLKDMILLLVKRLDTKMRHEYSMKLNRSSLNMHLKNFEKQHRGLVKNISKLTKILPQYGLNMESKGRVTKNVTAPNKRKKINRIKCKQPKENSTLLRSNTGNITDIANNTNFVFVDDDCGPNLVIDESSLELSDNIYINNSQCNKINTNKNIQETCMNVIKNDKKDKHMKKTKKKTRQSKKISEMEKPMLNEYQEWHRQKTMALKYFTIPMSDTSKKTSKDKIAQQQSSVTATEQQNNGYQTNIAIKRMNTETLATTSTEQQNNSCQTNIPIMRKNTEDIATTSTEQQNNSCQTTIPIKRINTEDLATISTEQQNISCQTTIPIKRKNTEDLATTSTEQQNNSCQTNIPIKRKNTEDIATISTEQQNNSCQTNIPIMRKNTEDLTTISTEQQNNSCQTNIPIMRKNTEDLATTSTEQQNNSCQTTIPIMRKNTEDLATTSTEQQNNSCQTNIPIMRKNTEDLATTSTEQQNNSCQTTIPIKRRNTEDLATTSAASDTSKRPKFHTNDSNVVYISDTSSDDDVQITKCYIAKDTNDNNPNTTEPDIHEIDKTGNGNNILFFNDTLQKQAVNQNICVINTPIAVSTQPVYLIINDTQMPTATQDDINKTQDSETINNPVVFQVLSNGTPFPTLTQVVPQNKTQQTQIVAMNEKCKLSNNCKCIKCENTLRDDILTCTLNLIQNVTTEDTRNNEPSTSLLEQNDSLIKEAITVKEYLSANKKLTALIKVDGSQKLLFFCSKYIILTDVNIPSSKATYRTSIRIKNKKKLSRVLVPSDSRGSVLLLGPKNDSDYIFCKCLKGARVKCNLCQRIKENLPHPTNLIKIDSHYYKNIGQRPIKYVRLNENELVSNSRAVLETSPDLILVNKMFFKKLTDSPTTYVRILSAPQDAATLRHLVRKEMLLYAFDITLTQNYFTPLLYAQTAGQITVDHCDKKLVKVLQWILN